MPVGRPWLQLWLACGCPWLASGCSQLAFGFGWLWFWQTLADSGRLCLDLAGSEASGWLWLALGGLAASGCLWLLLDLAVAAVRWVWMPLALDGLWPSVPSRGCPCLAVNVLTCCYGPVGFGGLPAAGVSSTWLTQASH